MDFYVKEQLAGERIVEQPERICEWAGLDIQQLTNLG